MTTQRHGSNVATEMLPPSRADAGTRRHGDDEAATTTASLPLQPPRVSFRGTSREPQGLWASHTAQRTEQARSTLFTLLFFSSPGLEPNPARLEASVHSSLDLKHFTAGEH